MHIPHNKKFLSLLGLGIAVKVILFAMIAGKIANHIPSVQSAKHPTATVNAVHAGPGEAAGNRAKASTQERRAERLGNRLNAHGLQAPGIAALMQALEDRKHLSNSALRITLVPMETSMGTGRTVTVQPADFHGWITWKGTAFAGTFVVNADAVQRSLDNGEIPGLSLARLGMAADPRPDRKQVLRASVMTVAKPGYDIDTATVAERIAAAFRKNEPEVKLEAAFREPSVTIAGSDGTEKTLELLATGLSDFAGSTANRTWNVHKALNEHVNNVIVPAGGTFSLVAALDTPVTLDKGWKEDLGLFGGGTALTPGAGICQSATTIYHAALLAGLPIVYKRNHSLFVDHYEPFGIGLDATVFPGFHDLKFRNDTGEDIVMQAYYEGDTAVVNLFGKRDGRTASMDGPYFTGDKRPAGLRALGYNEIGWIRTVTLADGSTQSQPLIASYAKPLWGSLRHKYANTNGMKLLTENKTEKKVL